MPLKEAVFLLRLLLNFFVMSPEERDMRMIISHVRAHADASGCEIIRKVNVCVSGDVATFETKDLVIIDGKLRECTATLMMGLPHLLYSGRNACDGNPPVELTPMQLTQAGPILLQYIVEGVNVMDFAERYSERIEKKPRE